MESHLVSYESFEEAAEILGDDIVGNFDRHSSNLDIIAAEDEFDIPIRMLEAIMRSSTKVGQSLADEHDDLKALEMALCRGHVFGAILANKLQTNPQYPVRYSLFLPMPDSARHGSTDDYGHEIFQLVDQYFSDREHINSIVDFHLDDIVGHIDERTQRFGKLGIGLSLLWAERGLYERMTSK